MNLSVDQVRGQLANCIRIEETIMLADEEAVAFDRRDETWWKSVCITELAVRISGSETEHLFRLETSTLLLSLISGIASISRDEETVIRIADDATLHFQADRSIVSVLLWTEAYSLQTIVYTVKSECIFALACLLGEAVRLPNQIGVDFKSFIHRYAPID